MHFNVIARYLEEGTGIYEWTGEADNLADAAHRAQLQAYADNHPSAVNEPGDEPSDMLDDAEGGGMSIMDITESVEAKRDVLAYLRANGQGDLARRTEGLWWR